jgi:lysophospholipase L1-like esterase
MIKSFCEKNKITYADFYSNMVDERKGLDKRFTNDGVHPTYTGYKIMDSLIVKSIYKILK